VRRDTGKHSYHKRLGCDIARPSVPCTWLCSVLFCLRGCLGGALVRFLTLHLPRCVPDGRWLNCSLTPSKPAFVIFFGVGCSDTTLSCHRPSYSNAVLKPIRKGTIGAIPTMVVSHVLGKFINSVVEKFELLGPEYAPVTAYQLPEHIAGYRKRNVEPVRWVLREGYCEFDCGAFMCFELLMICPLLGGPKYMLFWTRKEKTNAI
jgi:hypothetical protein